METNEKMLSSYELHLLEVLLGGAENVVFFLNYALKEEKSGHHARAMYEIADAVTTMKSMLVLSKRFVSDPDNVDNK
jgi:hypothetical protein